MDTEPIHADPFAAPPFDTTVLLEQREIPLQVARMDLDTFDAFDLQYSRMRRIWARAVPERKTPEERERAKVIVEVPKNPNDPDGPTVPKEIDGAYLISDEAVRARRDRELSPEALEARQDADEKDEQFGRTFVRDAILRYARVPPCEIFPNGLTGEALMQRYRGQSAALIMLVMKIRRENVLTEEQKKTSPSPFASGPGSAGTGERNPAADGPSPATTAASADDAGSAATAAATDPSSGRSSGMTAPSSSGPARS